VGQVQVKRKRVKYSSSFSLFSLVSPLFVEKLEDDSIPEFVEKTY